MFSIALLAIVLFGALARPEPAGAVPAQVAPDLSSIPVDSLPYRAAQIRYDTSLAALADAQQIATNGAAELDRLRGEDTRLTAALAEQTEAKKQATVDLASARASLRAIAVASYTDEPDGEPVGNAVGDFATGEDLDASTRALVRQALAGVVSTGQYDRATAARDTIGQLSHSINDALAQRSAARQRILQVQQLLDEAAASVARYADAVAAAQVDLGQTRVTANVLGTDFQLVALDAYRRAAATTVLRDPDCGLPWWALAGITRVESRHGTFGGSTLLYGGGTSQRIVGVPLDGENNTALIADSDSGLLDGDPVYDRAVGPMQFIPSTWRRYASDGNRDGVADPNNIYDAAEAAARYLCASGPMQTDDGMTRGFLSYNHSDAYAASVLRFAKAYAALGLPLP
ncbi:MAG TPA: lytic transglycosylase domain-containing protein [Acidimicrobiales bacterium]|nr:lytic transglycosylase domain-containing protein [Acidimicrobiales bacterium]